MCSKENEKADHLAVSLAQWGALLKLCKALVLVCTNQTVLSKEAIGGVKEALLKSGTLFNELLLKEKKEIEDKNNDA